MDLFLFLNKDFLKILSKCLTVKHITKVININKYFWELGKSNEVWQHLLKRDFNAKCMSFDKGRSIKEIYIEENKHNEIFSDIFENIKNGNIENVKSYLRGGGDINHTAEHGRTLLYYSCWYDYIAIVELLLSEGANINQARNNGQTPLHVACCNGYTSIVKLLLNKGVNTNQLDDIEESPLQSAMRWRYEEIVDLLLGEKKKLETKIKKN